MNIRHKIYLVLNLVASICYVIAFLTKNMYILGLAGCILIINAIIGIVFDFIYNRKKKHIK